MQSNGSPKATQHLPCQYFQYRQRCFYLVIIILQIQKMQYTQYFDYQVTLINKQNLHSLKHSQEPTLYNEPEGVLSSRPSSGKGQSINQNGSHEGSKHPWTKTDEEELYRLHDKLGNKWSIIAHHMPGRTDNCVKNHFYSKLRKALRKLNKAIHDCYRKQYKEIKMNAFYKIIETNEQIHKFRSEEYLKGQTYCNQFKNRLLQFADQFDQNSLQTQQGRQIAKKMIDQVVDFNRSHKRQPKKKRKSSAHEYNLPSIYERPKHLTTEDHISEDEEDSEGIFNSGSNKQQSKSFHIPIEIEPQIHFNFNEDFTMRAEQNTIKIQENLEQNEHQLFNNMKKNLKRRQKEAELEQQHEFIYDEQMGKHDQNLFDELIKQDQHENF